MLHRAASAVPRLNPIEFHQAGATSAALTPKPGFFNILYVHPQFGARPWASTASPLAPINSEKGMLVDPADRRATRLSWGHPAKQFGTAPEPGDQGSHPGYTQKNRRLTLQEPRFPASPSKHVTPGPPLPATPRLRAKTTFVPASTHPMVRLPPHTPRKKELYKALFGEKAPLGGWK